MGTSQLSKLNVTKHPEDRGVPRWPYYSETTRDRIKATHVKISNTSRRSFSERGKSQNDKELSIGVGYSEMQRYRFLRGNDWQDPTHTQLPHRSNCKVQIQGACCFVVVVFSLKNWPSMPPFMKRHQKIHLPKQGCEGRMNKAWVQEISSTTGKSKEEAWVTSRGLVAWLWAWSLM